MEAAVLIFVAAIAWLGLRQRRQRQAIDLLIDMIVKVDKSTTTKNEAVERRLVDFDKRVPSYHEKIFLRGLAEMHDTEESIALIQRFLDRIDQAR